MLMLDLLVLGETMVAVDQEVLRPLQRRRCARAWISGSLESKSHQQCSNIIKPRRCPAESASVIFMFLSSPMLLKRPRKPSREVAAPNALLSD